MLKVTILVSLMFIGILCAAHCDTCGDECVSACGTRHFGPCCFNYNRKKRGPDSVEFWMPNAEENHVKTRRPVFLMKYIPEDAISSILGNNQRIAEIIENQTK